MKLRIEEALHAATSSEADRRGVSMNEYIAELLAERAGVTRKLREAPKPAA